MNTTPAASSPPPTFLSRYRPGLLIVATEKLMEDVSLLINRYLPDALRFFVLENP